MATRKNALTGATEMLLNDFDSATDSIAIQILQLLSEISKVAVIVKDDTPVNEREYATMDEEAIYAQA